MYKILLVLLLLGCNVSESDKPSPLVVATKTDTVKEAIKEKPLPKDVKEELSAKKALAMATAYENGSNGKKDYKKAFTYYEIAANKGNAKAQFALSHLYANGNGVNKDTEKSREWLEKSAENGFSYAQYILGNFYYNRYLRTKESKYLDTSISWLKKASAKGYKNANALLNKIEKENP